MAAAPIGQIDFTEYPKGIKTTDRYEKLEQVGEGSYGQVFKARDKKTGELVALKKLRLENESEGFPITAIREIKILSKLDHPNVIKLKETVQSPGPERDKPDGNKYKGGIYMVFEYMEHDLAGLIERPGVVLTPAQIKCYMRQLLTGLHYCHVNKVLHRDIKASNLLMNNEGILKLADFGLAKSIERIRSNSKLTNPVITLWYRPPELLLGATNYGPAIDIWSAGCILAELLNGRCIFRGKTEADTLNQIFELCGAPDDSSWPGVSDLPLYTTMKPTGPMRRRLGEACSHFEKHALELLERMLTLNPAQRISAKDALVADYFWTDPLPSDPKSLPKYEASHFYEAKKRRQQLKIVGESQKMMPPKKCYGSQLGSSSHQHHSSGPYPPPSQERPSAGCHGGGGSGSGYGRGAPTQLVGYGSTHGSRHVPSFGSHGGVGSDSGYGGAPYYPQGYGSHSAGCHGGGSGSGYGAPNQPQGFGSTHGPRHVPGFGSGGVSSDSGCGDGAQNYVQGYGTSQGSRGVPTFGFHGGGGVGSGSGYGGGAPNQPKGHGSTHGYRDVPSFGSGGISSDGGRGGGAPNYLQGYGTSQRSRDVPTFGFHGGVSSDSSYRSGAPYYPQGFGLSRRSQAVPSFDSHGGGVGSGSGSGGGTSNHPQGYGPIHGSGVVPSYGCYGGVDSGSGHGGGAPTYPPGFVPSLRSRNVPTLGFHARGGVSSSSGYGGRDPNNPPGFGPSHGSGDVPSSGSHGGGGSGSGYGGGDP